ncbi:phage portal protein [Streptomyces sp. NPDC013740]|uniref:phage portal protein n=1 Tax=Streptomyces sp. NPDC013740 TaxID=3364867 RepID=UPI0036F98A7F
MPLPSGTQQWPPAALDPVRDKLTVWDAWYCGDPNALSAVYGGQVGSDPGGTGFFSSERGGWRGAVGRAMQRWFWGLPTPSGEQRSKLHVPIASDIATTSAALLFSEPPTVKSDDATTNRRLADLVDDGLHGTLLEAAELAAALGGVYLRIVWDREAYDAPWLDAHPASHAVPEWQWGRLSAVTFWRILEADGDRVLRHLERHEPGYILHGLYDGTRDELGVRVPLTEHPATAGIARVLGPSGDAIATGIKQLTAVYVPNMRPNRLWRGNPAAAHLGRPDIAGAEPLLDALDEVYTSWMRDVELGKGRVIVPSSYLESNGPGKGGSWDSDRRIYSTLNMLPRSGDAATIEAVQFEIRVAEHRDTAQNLVEQILRGAGYSSQTFGEQGQAAATATEVVARERQSFTTRNRKIVYWRPALAQAIETLLAIDQAVFSTGVKAEQPDIEFGDSISEDPKTIAETAELLNRAEAASRDTLVRMQHPDWEDAEVKAEVDRILEETGRLVADPTLTGAEGSADAGFPSDGGGSRP